MLIEILKAVLFGIVEGITEWLPISSTGHMILVDQFVHLNVSADFYKMFEVVIQLGAIMALFKMIWRKNMFRRFRYLFQFIKSDKKTRNKNPYYDMRRDGEDGVIPFCIAISIAALWEIF